MSIPVHMRQGNNYSGNSFSATYADSVIGAILPYGGATAPYGWFLCQGQAISRTDYSELFEVIGTSFGAGNGSTTFNLPDLRGEFLRGAGNNSHANQGNGGTVGTHQDGTVHIESLSDANNTYITATSNFSAGHTNSDYNYTSQNRYSRELSIKMTGYQPNVSELSKFTSRPTNTSVNFIIKAKYSASPAGDVLGVQDIRDTLGETPIPSDLGTSVTGALSNIGNRFNYSTSEKVVGKWIDGKPLYQRVLTGTLASATTTAVDDAVFSDNAINLIYAFGRTVRTNDNTIFQIPYAQNANRNDIAPWMYSVYQQKHIIYIRRSYGTENIDSATYNYQLVIQYTKTTD